MRLAVEELTEQERIVLRKALDQFAAKGTDLQHDAIVPQEWYTIEYGERAIARRLSFDLT